MHIGILQTGLVAPEFVDAYGEYPDMFAELLRKADPTVKVTAWPVLDGTLPKQVDACDAWLLTGSKHGVYDDLPWIEPLKTFLRDARAAGVPLIGICFGHQIMAEAFGGRAEKSDKGWGCGVHDYEITERPGWLEDAPETMSFHAMHQDQVTALPDDATCLASSPFCTYAMVAYGDAEQPEAISIQPHPEFGRDYAEDLVRSRRGDVIPPDQADAALPTFGQSVDTQDFANWVSAYLQTRLGQGVSTAAE